MDLVDVFVYLVVLGVFIQLFPDVISESFLLALLTAILLKAALECVVWLKLNIKGRIKAARSGARRTVNIVALLLVLPGSKFVLIELIDVIFGDAVQLGNFFQVTALVIILMLARGGARRLFERTDKAEAAAP